MTQLTFVIPVASYHHDVVQHAVEAVRAQTVPCAHIVIDDAEGHGAGYARNRGLEQVRTDYVAFLDADDIVDPRFAEICLGILAHYAASGKADSRYVYTDWLGRDNIGHKAPDPCDAWTNGTSHLVTTVMRTADVRRIGGFDEQMAGIEDADFYVRLRLSGVCGIHVNAPLVQYREGGQRSIMARADGTEISVKHYMTQRYGGLPRMGCCGDTVQHDIKPENEPTDGDILVQAKWQGNQRVMGRATGRLYPRTSYPKLLYVAEVDVNAAPAHWQRVGTPMQASNGVILQPQYKASGSEWQTIANAIFGGGTPQPAAQPIEAVYKPHVTGRSKAAVVKGAQEWTRVEGELE